MRSLRKYVTRKKVSGGYNRAIINNIASCKKSTSYVMIRNIGIAVLRVHISSVWKYHRGELDITITSHEIIRGLMLLDWDNGYMEVDYANSITLRESLFQN